MWHSSSIFWLFSSSISSQEIHHGSMRNGVITRVQEIGLISKFNSGHLFGTGNPTSRWVVWFVSHLGIYMSVGPFRNCPSFRAGSAQAVNTSRLEVWGRWRLGLLPFLQWRPPAAVRVAPSTSQGWGSSPPWPPCEGPGVTSPPSYIPRLS